MEQVTITQKEFDSLPNYSCTLPTGTIIGKRWRRGEPYKKPTQWYIGQYIDIGSPTRVGIKWIKIVAIFRIKKTEPDTGTGKP